MSKQPIKETTAFKEYREQRIKDYVWLQRNIRATRKSLDKFPTPTMIILHRKLKEELVKWEKEGPTIQ